MISIPQQVTNLDDSDECFCAFCSASMSITNVSDYCAKCSIKLTFDFMKTHFFNDVASIIMQYVSIKKEIQSSPTRAIESIIISDSFNHFTEDESRGGRYGVIDCICTHWKRRHPIYENFLF